MSDERQYQIVVVERGQPGELEKYCDDLVRRGFEPIGGPLAAGDRVMQAMWRRQDEALVVEQPVAGNDEEGAEDDGNT